MHKLKFVLLLVLIPIITFSSTLTKTVYFNSADMQMLKVNDGNDMVVMSGCINIKKPGYPILPAKPANILLPQGAVIKGVKVIRIDRTVLGKNFLIQPAGKPQIISHPKPERFIANPKVYGSDELYPSNVVEFSGQGYKDGFNLGALLIYPIQYAPLSGELQFINSVTFSIDYEINAREIKSIRDDVYNMIKNTIENMVINPEDIQSYRPERRITTNSRVLETDTIPYVIVTTSDYENVLRPLADWKTQKGLKAKIVDLSYIYSNYSGTDNSEKIRNFIIDAHNTWGTMYVLLGGQCDFENGEEVVPRRDVFYTSSGAGYYADEDTIISDLYYADLDGDWNANGNSVYGEVNDNVDMYTDVYVGRAPIKNNTQANAFVNKTLTYEKNAPAGYLTKTLLPAVELFSSYNFWGDTVNNDLANIAPAGWENEKLYESIGNLSRGAVTDSMNNGVGFVHHACHGNETGLYYASGSIVSNNSDIDGLSNGSRLGIFFSIGCFTGAMDEVSGGDCFAEHVVNNPNGGGVLSMYNSRYGWGDPPDLGASELLDTLYYAGLFEYGKKTHGEAIAYAKDQLVPVAVNEGTNGVTRWCMYELNTFGDPELHPFTSEVMELSASYPDTLFIGSAPVTVNVTDAGTGNPIEDARVCIMRDSTVYSTGLTDASGNVTLSPVINSTGDVLITITANNHHPIQDTLGVKQNNDAYVSYKSNNITFDTNGNGQINPGENVSIKLLLVNNGALPSHGVYAKISSTDSFVTISTDSVAYGDIASGDSAWSISDYSFSVSNSLPDNHNILFDVQIKDTDGHTWNNVFSMQAYAPEVSEESFEIEDGTTGNGNGKWDVGEQVELIFGVKNSGGETAKNVSISISTSTSGITIDDGSAVIGDIESDSVSSNTSDALMATASASVANGTPVEINYTISGDNIGDVSGSVSAVVGQKAYIIFDIDPNHSSGPVMDSLLNELGYAGDYYTSFSPMIDSLSNYASAFVFAGIYSSNSVIDQTNGGKLASWCTNDGGMLYLEGGDMWYWDPQYSSGYDFSSLCGVNATDDGSGDLATASGASGTFTAGMSFGYSGENNYIDHIDATGSGFVIFSNTSASYNCGVANDAGSYKTVGLSFEFGGLTDGSGVSTKLALADSIMQFFGIEAQGITDRSRVSSIERRVEFGIKARGSNIVSGEAEFSYGITKSGRVEVKVYDASGRMVRGLVDGEERSGYHTVRWDGRDGRGRRVRRGIYFVRLSSSGKSMTSKLLFMK